MPRSARARLRVDLGDIFVSHGGCCVGGCLRGRSRGFDEGKVGECWWRTWLWLVSTPRVILSRRVGTCVPRTRMCTAYLSQGDLGKAVKYLTKQHLAIA